MQNKPDLFVTLIIIYLALLTLCIVIYAILQLYVAEIDRGTATNLMIWSATLFPSIALLYTFNSWKEQKQIEEIAKLASELHRNLVKSRNFYLEIARYVDSINLKISDLDKDTAREVLKIFEDNISPYQHEIQKIKNYCNNNVHIQKIEKYLEETSLIYSYIIKISYEIQLDKGDISTIKDYFETYSSMNNSFFEISIYKL